MAEMEKVIPLMWLGYILFAPFFVFLYAKGIEPKNEVFGQGLRFGLIFGVGLSAMTNLVWYTILPIPGGAGVLLVPGRDRGVRDRRCHCRAGLPSQEGQDQAPLDLGPVRQPATSLVAGCRVLHRGR